MHVSETRDRKEFYAEVGKYSSAGQDFSFNITFDSDNADDIYFGDLVYEYSEDFDQEEEAERWSEESGGYDEGNPVRVGRNGAPGDFGNIVKDMEKLQCPLSEEDVQPSGAQFPYKGYICATYLNQVCCAFVLQCV